MKLWVDGQCLQTGSRVRGVGRYVLELTAAIREFHRDVDLHISLNAAMMVEAFGARDMLGQYLDSHQIHVWQGLDVQGEAAVGLTEERRLSEIALAHHVAALGPDIALSASPLEGGHDQAVPLLPSTILACPVASIFYDAIPLRFPAQYLTTATARAYFDRRMACYGKFDANLCISEFARSELLSLSAGSPAVHISAGISRSIRTAAQHRQPRPSGLPTGAYVLYVGGLDWRKNVGAIVAAFAKLPGALRHTLKLVMVGDPGDPRLLDDLRHSWRNSGLPSGNLLSLQHVADDELVAAYQGASVLVQPSLMEGFGLSVVEAMYCGAPVAVSRGGALPELVGREDLLFDPQDPQELSELLCKAVGDAAFAERAAAFGRDRALAFTWERSAGAAIAAMETAIAGRIRAARDLPLQELRERTLLEARALKIDRSTVAHILARAEPLPNGPPRLIVDATATAISDAQSGIQRVVKKTLRSLVGSETSGPAVVVGYCDRDQVWYELAMGADEVLPKIDKLSAPRLTIGANDTVLMLDSSWNIHNNGWTSLHAARLRGAEVISCLYDTVPLRHPAFCDPGMPPVFASWLTAALAYSTGFVCISKAVADELLDILTAIRFPRPMKVGYWHLGADFSAEAAVPSRNPDVEAPLRFLMVGTIEPRKGHNIALDAFELLWAEGAEVELVIAGKPGWGNDHSIQRLRTHQEAGRRLRWVSGASDDVLRGLYHETDALIASSYAEGFGLPLVEARHFGKAVIASDIPVFREIMADASQAQFFELGSSAGLADAVRRFATNREGGGAEPSETMTWLSWDQSAAQLRDVVVSGRWYRTYQPRQPNPFVSTFDTGNVRMSEPIAAKSRRHRLELVQGAIPARQGSLKHIVRVTNLSDQVWSSQGPNGHGLGVVLSYQAVAEDGATLTSNNATAAIPFVLIPGDSIYLSLEVSSDLSQRGAAFVDVELIQEGVARWGSPLRLSL